ncbi:hypothetical protein HK405_009262 [Cladochytrium tenue]|nr:hypothetical protein HK405_009262 [Cladochytrium tenue]
MATVVRELFGRYPRFLLGDRSRGARLLPLLAPLPAHGVGAHVARAEDVAAGRAADSFWTVTRVIWGKNFQSGKVYGVRTVNGRPARSGTDGAVAQARLITESTSDKGDWRLLVRPSESASVRAKLRM